MVRKPTSSTVEAAASAYIQARRGRAAIRPAPSAGIAAEKVLRPLARRFGVGVDQLREHWPEIVGSRLAQWSSPESLQRSGGIHTLVIRARGPAGAIIQAESRRILERVGTFSGRQAPTRIRVIQGSAQSAAAGSERASRGKMTQPQSSSQVSETVETSAEARLLSALDRMSRSIKARDGH
ncbi:DciA family protein [Maricaulis alexandrii]|jgi:hypothetical protein|uniref:DciA family protein n=1 Tax=Maricaulis alexandrii TaxID=2570354 RepID=UPI001108808A|nr:DciA family protein [Maricaulis alexandrii]